MLCNDFRNTPKLFLPGNSRDCIILIKTENKLLIQGLEKQNTTCPFYNQLK